MLECSLSTKYSVLVALSAYYAPLTTHDSLLLLTDQSGGKGCYLRYGYFDGLSRCHCAGKYVSS